MHPDSKCLIKICDHDNIPAPRARVFSLEAVHGLYRLRDVQNESHGPELVGGYIYIRT